MREWYIAVYLEDAGDFAVHRMRKGCVVRFKPVRDEEKRREYAKRLMEFLKRQNPGLSEEEVRIYGIFDNDYGDFIVFFASSVEIPE